MTAGARYRLPDWLGGHEVYSPSEVGEDGCRRVDIVLPEGSPGTLRVPAGYLVEIRPPSIDDPVTLPLRIKHGTSWLEIRRWVGGLTPGAEVAMGEAGAPRETYRIMAPDCLDLARALWRLGTEDGAS